MSRSVAASAFMGILACVLVGALFYVPGMFKPVPAGPEQQLELYRDGVRTLFQHKFSEAEAIFERLVKIAPNEPEAWLVLAMAQLNQAEKGVDQALLSLRRSDELRPNDARVYFCLGLIYQFLEELDQSYAAFAVAVQLAPWSPDAHYQHGKSLVRQRKYEEALPHFEAAVTGNPALSAAWYQVGFLYRRLKRPDDAMRAQEMFKALDASDRARERGLVFTELGELAEPDPAWVPEGIEQQRAERKPTFAAAVPLENAAPPMAFVDLEFDGTVDLWTAGSAPAAWDLSGESPKVRRTLEPLTDAFSFAVGDFNVDGRPDLAVGLRDAVRTYRGRDDGTFAAAQTFAGFADAAVRLIDMDLEGDLDLVVTDAVTEPKLLINAHADGEEKPQATFHGPEKSPLGALEQRSRLLVAHDFDRDGDAECIFGNESLKYLVDNGPQWKFDVMPSKREVPLDSGVQAIAAADFDGDGWDDLVSVGSAKTGIWWGSGQGQFIGDPAYGSLLANRGAVHLADLNADGLLDIIAGSANDTSILLNSGNRRFTLASGVLPAALGFASADVDGDHDVDLVVQTIEKGLQFFRNTTVDGLPDREQPKAIRFYLGGERDSQDRRTNLHGIGARVDILIGTDRHSRVYDGGLSDNAAGQGAQGLQPVTVAVGDRSEVQTVLIWWPDGVVQSEGPLEAGRLHTIDEVQRKESSCPVLFTWDGEQYRFITDFMGGGGLGFWIALDEYGPPDPTEVVRIEPGAFAPIDGHYRLAILEPMEEVAYIDQLAVIAIDHPADVEVYPFELFATSAAVTPTGEPMGIRASERVFPVAAMDSQGESRLAELLEVDRKYAGPVRIDPTLVGYAPRHDVRLTFDRVPQHDELYLFLDGWVEYPYSRINFAASHRGDRLESPTFSWRSSETEEWKVLFNEVGYPAGMPKTMVLPLAALPESAHDGFELRIETNMEVYWDRIFLAPRAPLATETEPNTLEVTRAILRFGGYPREYSDDGAWPPTYHYQERDAHIPYTPMPGFVTRYGDVRALIDTVNDEFAIVGGGDELWLEVKAPPLAPGMVRTLFLDTHGYCKDLDTLTAAGDAVTPLPFFEMSNYPPSETDVAPDRSKYEATYNTRRD
ncbi:MAG: FG-GAP-like repeat-containing protein [Planctomycetota bacterium]